MAAFAEVEEPPDEPVGFPREQFQAGAQLLVAMLNIQVHGPEVGDGCPVQETIPREPLHQGLKLLYATREMVSADPWEQVAKVGLEATPLHPNSDLHSVTTTLDPSLEPHHPAWTGPRGGIAGKEMLCGVSSASPDSSNWLWWLSQALRSWAKLLSSAWMSASGQLQRGNAGWHWQRQSLWWHTSSPAELQAM